MDIDFNESIAIDSKQLSVRAVIRRSFNTSQGIGARPVTASKILHVVNPGLFVMWDRRIIRNYHVDDTADGYANCFLPWMQRLVKDAICQIMDEDRTSREDAVRSLTPCSHSLAKVLDEYNFMVSR